MSKQPRVPGTRAAPRPNREQRRHPESADRQQAQRPPGDEPARPEVSGEPDPRAKSSGHGKKTADKWNQ